MSRMSFKRKFKRFIKTHGHLSKGTYIGIGVFLFLVLLFDIYELFLIPKIDLKGKDEVTLNYKEKYVEKGFKASYLGNDVTDEVKLSGKVNPKKLGTYEIKYKVGSGIFSKTVIRTVVVEDKEKPKIEISKDDVYVCPDKETEAEQAKAIDNYDGDLTKKIRVKIEEDKIVYRVTDSSGNTRTVTRKVYHKDIEKPSIMLNGAEQLYLFVGDNYSDPGVKATDNCDGDITAKVAIENKVNTGAPGDYEVIYRAKDTAGNESAITRKVKVSEKAKGGVVYLTFDDGPQSGTTDVILDILKAKGVKATFFVTNKGPDSLIKREFD